MHRVKNVSAGHGYTLEVEFTDGVKGRVDLSQRLFGTMFEPLKDRALFQQVKIDEFGAVCWPNGADLAPDALYIELAHRHPSEALAN
jgi:Protein of unknown function (DUF2442)